MRGTDGRFKRILTVCSREQQGAGLFKLPRRSADALAAAEARGECTAVYEPRKPQPLKAYNEFNKGLCLYDAPPTAARGDEPGLWGARSRAGSMSFAHRPCAAERSE